MLSVFLLFPGSEGYVTITQQKNTLFSFFTLGYLAAMGIVWLELILIEKRTIEKPAEVWKSRSLCEKLIVAFWLLSGISVLLSNNKAIAFWGSARCEGFFTLTLYLASFLMVAKFAKAQKMYLYVFGAAMSAMCILCIVQFTGANPLHLYPEGMNYYDGGKLYAGEFLGTIGNADVVVAVLCIAVPLFSSAVILLRSKLRFLLLVPLALCLFVLIKARVAAGIVGALGAAAVCAVVFFKERKSQRLCLLGITVLAAGSIAAVYFFGEKIGGTIAEASAILHGNISNNFGSGRIYIWKETLRLVPERLLFGGGPDTLGLRLDAAFERYDESLGMLIRSSIDTAHNEYLNILVNQGVLAFAAYLAALAAALILWACNALRDAKTAICGAAVLGYLIQALFSFTSPASTPFFWIALGMLVRAEKDYKNERIGK